MFDDRRTPPGEDRRARGAPSNANQLALSSTLLALTGLDEQHTALVEHAKTLARLLDEYPTEVKLHSEYRQVMAALLLLGKPKEQDAIDALLAELRGE